MGALCKVIPLPCAREITERPHAPSGVAAIMSAHSKTPYITPSMDISFGKGVIRGHRGQQLGFALSFHCHARGWCAQRSALGAGTILEERHHFSCDLGAPALRDVVPAPVHGN